MNIDPKWLQKMAELEANGIISVGGQIVIMSQDRQLSPQYQAEVKSQFNDYWQVDPHDAIDFLLAQHETGLSAYRCCRILLPYLIGKVSYAQQNLIHAAMERIDPPIVDLANAAISLHNETCDRNILQTASDLLSWKGDGVETLAARAKLDCLLNEYEV